MLTCSFMAAGMAWRQDKQDLLGTQGLNLDHSPGIFPTLSSGNLSEYSLIISCMQGGISSLFGILFKILFCGVDWGFWQVSFGWGFCVALYTLRTRPSLSLSFAPSKFGTLPSIIHYFTLDSKPGLFHNNMTYVGFANIGTTMLFPNALIVDF